MISFAATTRRRRPSLTPMIDVVFLLLVFFMLAARFGQVGAIPLRIGWGGAADWQGPPRLVDVGADALRLNGLPVAEDGLAEALRPLLPAPDAPVILRGGADADLARLTQVIEALARAGITNIVLVE